MIVCPISFTEKQYRRLKERSQETGVSMAALTRLALGRYLGEMEDAG